ncbi:MAG: NADH:flavin oxidoreductase, partial [Gammaproteobacteria bacterium]
VEQGCDVTLVTPSAFVSAWTSNTLEQASIHARLVELGVSIVLNRAVSRIEGGQVVSECVFTGREESGAAEAVVMVASRIGNDSLWQELSARQDEWQVNGIKSIKLIGDAESPAPIAWATYAGHRYARELDMPDIGDDLPFRREVTQLKD